MGADRLYNIQMDPPPFLLPWLLLLLLLKKKDTILILITHLHAFVLIFWRNDIRVDWRKGGGVGLAYTFVHDILALSMFKCAKKKNNKTSDSIV